MRTATVYCVSPDGVTFAMKTEDDELIVADSDGIWVPYKGCTLSGAMTEHGRNTLLVTGTSQTANVFIQARHCSAAGVVKLLRR